MILYIYPFISKQLFSGITSLTGSDIFNTKMLSIFLLSNFVTVAFDSHPDGYWILGWCLYYLNLEAMLFGIAVLTPRNFYRWHPFLKSIQKYFSEHNLNIFFYI